jgi:hypothetical protein
MDHRARIAIFGGRQRSARRVLAFAAVVDLEFVTGVGGEKNGDVAEALGEGGSGEERVFALAEVVVVEVNSKGEHVDGESVGERRLEKA